MTEIPGGNFSYSIARNGAFLVLSLFGDLRLASGGDLERCMGALESGTEGYCTINCQDLGTVDPGMVPRLIQLQKMLRDRKGALRLCAMNDEIRKFLLDKGAVRDSECSDTLQEALVALKTIQSREMP